MRTEGDSGASSIYNALVNIPDYADLVAEFWRTAESCSLEVPKLRKDALQLGRTRVTQELAPKLQASVVNLTRVTPLIRPGQAAVLTNQVLLKCEALAQKVAADGGE